MEKRSHNRKHIVKLNTDENEYLEEPNEILLEMEHFYKTLYTSQLPEVSTFNESSKPFLNPENVPKLNPELQNTCEGPGGGGLPYKMDGDARRKFWI